MIWSIIGISGATLTTFSFIPQVIKIIRKKSAQDVSLLTLLQLACGVSLWVIYGIHLKDVIIITANLVTLSTLVIAIYLFFKYK